MIFVHKLDEVLLHYGVKGMKWDEKKEEVEEDVKKKAKAAKAQAKVTASKIVAALKKQKKAAGKGVKKATKAAGKTVDKATKAVKSSVKTEKTYTVLDLSKPGKTGSYKYGPLGAKQPDNALERGLKRAKSKATDAKTKAKRAVEGVKSAGENVAGFAGHVKRQHQRSKELEKALVTMFDKKPHKPKDIPYSKWEKKQIKKDNDNKITKSRVDRLDAKDSKDSTRSKQTAKSMDDLKREGWKLKDGRFVKSKSKKSNSVKPKNSKTDKPKKSNAETLTKILSADAKASTKARRENTAKVVKKGINALDKKTKPLRDKINKKASDAIRNSEPYKKGQKTRAAINERISNMERKRDNTRSVIKERVSGMKKEHENTKKAVKDRVSGMKREHEKVKSNVKKRVNGLLDSNGSSKRRKDLQNLVSNLTTEPKKKSKIPNNPRRITR